jgi:hypothetical protein
MFQRLSDSLATASSLRTGPAVLCQLDDNDLSDDQARTLFDRTGAPQTLWPVIATARSEGWVIDHEWMDRAVLINQVPGSNAVLRETWLLLAAPTSVQQSDDMWEYLTPLVTYRLRRALDDCPSSSEWDHLIHLCRTAVGLLEQGSHEAAQTLSSVILTTVTDKLDAEYGDSRQRFGSNIRRPRPVKNEPSGRDFIRQHSWVHIADDWLILPAVNSHFDRSDPAWIGGDSYSRHIAVHGADSAHQYRPANAARATAAAVSIVRLITHPATQEEVRSMIHDWVADDLAGQPGTD